MPALTFILGDARRVPEWLNKKFKVVFCSGFTPDEFWKHQIIEDAIDSTWPPNEFGGGENWPGGAATLAPVTDEILETGLENGGLFISLSYAGVCEPSNTFLSAMQNHLAQMGIQLIEVYFLLSAPKIMLFIGLKGTIDDASTFSKKLENRDPISVIHGRTAFPPNAVKIFDWDDSPQIRPMELSIPWVSRGLMATNFAPCIANLVERYRPDLTKTIYAGVSGLPEIFWLSRETSCTHHITLKEPGGVQYKRSKTCSANENEIIFHLGSTPEVSEQIGLATCCYFNSTVEEDSYRDKIMAEVTGEYLWPIDKPPIHCSLIEIIDTCLDKNGLLFLQGRSGGVSVPHSPEFINSLRRQLASIGTQLLDIHYFIESPGIFFIAAIRASFTEATACFGELAMRLPLLHFYGQSEQDSGVQECWNIVDNSTP
jgi:hypothetical protein